MTRGRGLTLAALAGTGGGLYLLVLRGSLTLDLGVGRRIRPLGPIVVEIDAPRDLVFDVIAAPYLERTPRALERKLRVLERGEDVVLAEHFTQVGPVVTTTLETVRFERPERVLFRLVRGPVPFVVEEFVLDEGGIRTTLTYRGRLGADLWALGRLWSAATARVWEKTVRASLDAVRAEAERRAARL